MFSIARVGHGWIADIRWNRRFSISSGSFFLVSIDRDWQRAASVGAVDYYAICRLVDAFRWLVVVGLGASLWRLYVHQLWGTVETARSVRPPDRRSSRFSHYQ